MPENQMSVDEFAQSVKSKYPQYKDWDNADLTRAMLKKYPQYKSWLKTMEPRKGPSLLTQPKEYLAKRSGELTQQAQMEKYKAEGPESVGKGVMSRLGHEMLSLVPETAAFADKSLAAMLDPKNAALISAGAINPAIPAIGFGAQGLKDLPEVYQQYKKEGLSPDVAQRGLVDLSMAVGGAATRPQATPAGAKIGEVVGKKSRAYAEKVATEMTGQIPDKKTGINEPGKVAEATREVTTLKDASDKYAAKASDATRKVEMKAQEAKVMGVALTPQETQAVYTMMDKLYKRSGSLKAMLDFDQLKSPLWKGQRPGYLDPMQMLELRRDLDEIINYDTKSGKRQPTANAAHDVRTALDMTLDKKVPGWQDLNESSSALIKASEKLQERYDKSFFQKIRASFSDVLSHPISTIGPGYLAYEISKAAGAPHYMNYITAVGASGVAHYLYDSLPSQTARIMMADSLADVLIGKRPAKGPKSYAPTAPPERQIADASAQAFRTAAEQSGMKKDQIDKIIAQSMNNKGLQP